MNHEDKKKKIIIVGPSYPYRGGNVLFVSHVYDKLKEKFDVKLLNYTLLYPSIFFPGTTQYDESNNKLIDINSKRIVNSINPFTWIKAAGIINKENPDLVVFDWWQPFFGPCHFFISLFLKKSLKRKILFMTENVTSHEGFFVDKLLTKLGFAFAKGFLVLSDKVGEEAKYIKPSGRVYRTELPVYDVYKRNESVEGSKEELGYKPDDKLILFFGYIRKYKGLDILIEAFPKILNKIPEAKLLIVGEFYDEPDLYLDLIKKLGLEDKVKVINKFIPNEEVGKYYNYCDVVVLPYRSATQSGILNVSYGFNKPVVTVNVGGLGEFVIDGKTGVVVDKPEADSIANGVIKFFDLQKTVDFKANILNWGKTNIFDKLNETFENIIDDNKKVN